VQAVNDVAQAVSTSTLVDAPQTVSMEFRRQLHLDSSAKKIGLTTVVNQT